jgi:hypothetical protein
MLNKTLSYCGVLAAVLCLGTIGHVAAATIYFDVTSGDYAVPTNWSNDALPTSSDTAYIGYESFTPATATISTDLSATLVNTLRIGIGGVGSLTMNDGGGLSYTWFVVADKTSTTAPLIGTGTYVQNAGTLNVSASGSSNGGYYIGNLVGCVGTHTMNGGTLNMGSSSRIGNAYIGHYGSGSLYIHDGTFTVSNASSYLTVALLPGSTGLFSQDGGVVSLQNLVIARGPATQVGGTGTVVISDDARFTVNQAVIIGDRSGDGKFELQGSLASVEWKTNATFGGKSTLSFVADAAGVSSILMSSNTATLSIGSGALLSLNLAALKTAAKDLVLINNCGVNPISGTFTNFAEGAKFDFTDGSYYTLTYVYDFGGDGAKNDLALVAHPIPEPSALALLAGGLVGLLAYAWRKRK